MNFRIYAACKGNRVKKSDVSNAKNPNVVFNSKDSSACSKKFFPRYKLYKEPNK